MLGDRLRSDCSLLFPDMASRPPIGPLGMPSQLLGPRSVAKALRPKRQEGAVLLGVTGCGLRLDWLIPSRNPGWGQVDNLCRVL